MLSNTFCSSTMIPLCSGSQSWLDNAADRHDRAPPPCPLSSVPPLETYDYPECTMITGRCSAQYSLMSNRGREVFIYCFYGAIIEYWWFYVKIKPATNHQSLAWTLRFTLVEESGLGCSWGRITMLLSHSSKMWSPQNLWTTTWDVKDHKIINNKISDSAQIRKKLLYFQTNKYNST